MTAKSKPQSDPQPRSEQKPLLELARKVLLAGIGAMALAQDEVEEFVYRLVERGEIAEKDGRKLVRDILDRREQDVSQIEDKISQRVEEIMKRMNVPTRSDIDHLAEKIAALTEKVDRLQNKS